MTDSREADSPEMIAMRRRQIETLRADPNYRGTAQEAEDEAWLAGQETRRVAYETLRAEAKNENVQITGLVRPPEVKGETGSACDLRGEYQQVVVADERSFSQPETKPAFTVKDSRLSDRASAGTSMPTPTCEAVAQPSKKMPALATPGKLCPEYELARKISDVENISKRVFATKTADPERKRVEAERKRANDMVNLVQQLLDQRGQLAVALANVSSTVRLKDVSQADLNYMADISENLSKTIVGGLTPFDIQSYTVIAGLNGLKEDQNLRRAGSGSRDAILNLAHCAASMLADTRFKIEQLRTAGLAALAERDALRKQIAELTGEPVVEDAMETPTVN